MGVRKDLSRTINTSKSMANIIVGIIALLLIVYLFFTIIRPEKF